ncbi:MAG: DUF1343 domain-containing protein [Ferruginibacter sp.]
MQIITFLFILLALIPGQENCNRASEPEKITPGAERMSVYLPMLKGKRVAVFANQTSMVKNTHLVDTLIKSGINVVKIFGPEHGFRGTANAGEHVDDAIDKQTGISVISLYGKHRRPTTDDLKGVDVLLFDIQDVGVRFYTYISSLQEYMEAAFENKIPLMILDRPNPNGFYVDGPVLDTAFKSFIGMQPVPVVYGMTIAEYAMMIAGEKWLSKKANATYDFYKTANNSADTPFHFQVIKNANYDHNSKYVLPVMPSPNLKEMQAIYWYPSTCFFEGTVLSEGRGTEKPFEYFGHPLLPKNLFSFTPAPNEGSKNSKNFYKKCYGWDVSGSEKEVLKKVDGQIQLSYLIHAYKLFPGKDSFFLKNNFINRLAGNNFFAKQIAAGLSEKEIKKSWQPKLTAFKAIRKKYLLYKDFE